MLSLRTWRPLAPADLTTELQGHAIKNQDLLIASGTISSRGTEGLSAVDEDVEAAAAVRRRLAVLPRAYSRQPADHPAMCSSRATALL